jgi:hypothetical protein
MLFMRHIRSLHFVRASLPVAFFALAALGLQAQDAVTIFGGGTTGSQTRIAAADFKPASPDAKTDELKHTFDTTLFNDLTNAGIFEMVSKSVAPPVQPGSPAEINLAQWSSAPANAAYVAFGSLAVNGAKLSVNGFLFDTKNPQFPSVLAKQYGDDASTDSARQIAHRFADEIILRLSGTPGIAETKIYYVHASGGNKEIWEMDYDGANQHPLTHLGTVSLSPRVSPDNSRLAFSSLGRDGFQIKMYSLSNLAGNEPFAGVVAGRQYRRLLIVALGRSGDLSDGHQRRHEPAYHQLPRARCVAGIQSAHRSADRVDQWTDWAAAALYDGDGRLGRAAPDRWRLCDFAVVVAEWTVCGVCVEPQVWPRRARRPRHLRDGDCHQTLDSAHA